MKLTEYLKKQYTESPINFEVIQSGPAQEQIVLQSARGEAVAALPFNKKNESQYIELKEMDGKTQLVWLNDAGIAQFITAITKSTDAGAKAIAEDDKLMGQLKAGLKAIPIVNGKVEYELKEGKLFFKQEVGPYKGKKGSFTKVPLEGEKAEPKATTKPGETTPPAGTDTNPPAA